MAIGVLTLQIHLPGCSSLKEKRSRLKPLISRLHKEFNISVAEVEQNDAWREAVIACAIVSNDHNHAQQALQNVSKWIDVYWPDIQVEHERLELI
ncbi:MAG: hypothetical protein A2Z16_02585 [Chloroflexi bacterium RBG_16_54_18]|nr:MAG: hypothetical protein A2Z16_02585 [Chloroflexi bacterium RBG_16_54_18]